MLYEMQQPLSNNKPSDLLRKHLHLSSLFWSQKLNVVSAPNYMFILGILILRVKFGSSRNIVKKKNGIKAKSHA